MLQKPFFENRIELIPIIIIIAVLSSVVKCGWLGWRQPKLKIELRNAGGITQNTANETEQCRWISNDKTTKLHGWSTWMHVGAQKDLKSQVCSRCELWQRSSLNNQCTFPHLYGGVMARESTRLWICGCCKCSGMTDFLRLYLEGSSLVSWSAGLKSHLHHFLQRPHDMFPPSTHSHQERIGKKCGLEVHRAKTSTPADKARLALRRGKSRRWWGERGLDTISSAKRSTRQTRHSTSLRSLKRYMFSFALFRGLEDEVYLSFNCCHTKIPSRPCVWDVDMDWTGLSCLLWSHVSAPCVFPMLGY